MGNDLSQIDLAGIIEVSNGQLGNIESPKFSHKYTLRHLYIISNYFKVSIEFLLTGNTDKLESEELIKYLIKYDE